MAPWLAVGFGGFLGAVGRYKLGDWILHHYPNEKFPLGTFAVNIMGCFLIGIIAGYIERHHNGAPAVRLFLITGLLGGFTTFSAFGFETFYLLKRGDISFALANVILSPAVGLLAIWLGALLAGGWKTTAG